MAVVEGRFCATAVVVSIVAAITKAVVLPTLSSQGCGPGPKTHTEPGRRPFRTQIAGSSIGDLMDGPLHGVLLERVHFTPGSNNNVRGLGNFSKWGGAGLVPAENTKKGPIKGTRVPHRLREKREDAGLS